MIGVFFLNRIKHNQFYPTVDGIELANDKSNFVLQKLKT